MFFELKATVLAKVDREPPTRADRAIERQRFARTLDAVRNVGQTALEIPDRWTREVTRPVDHRGIAQTTVDHRLFNEIVPRVVALDEFRVGQHPAPNGRNQAVQVEQLEVERKGEVVY